MLEAGFGSADMTPRLGMQTSLSVSLKITAIVTPLQVKVCLIRCRSIMTAIVSVDTTSLYSCVIDDMRRVVSKATGVTVNRIVLNSTHTHSSPFLHRSAQDYLDRRGLRFLNRDYYEQVLQSVERAAIEAFRRLKAVKVKCSTGQVSEVACNRRVPLEDGTIGVRYGRGVSAKLRAYPDGLIDPDVSCAWFIDGENHVIGSMINYACHATSYNQLSEICWDFPGFAAQAVERELGGICMFLQGCAGNISPGKYTVGEPLADCMNMGSRVAEAASGSYSSAQDINADELFVDSGLVATGLRIMRGEEELKLMLDAEIAGFRAAHSSNPDLCTGEYNSANILSLAERLVLLDRYPDLQMASEITVIKLGKLVLVFMPGELFIQSALRLKNEFPHFKLMIMAYADVSLEYVPCIEAYAEKGGYETCEEWCFSIPGNAEKLESRAAAMIRHATEMSG
ncbi:hypothetical protein [Paenibacillus sp. GCM10027626]|uniref:hypothetical protein n=1 Tax=Paenibacillus sp. GCM10027626 TaxID=3273411 RepID=UPI00363FD9E6